MAERTFAWVPIDALRDLVRYADEQRTILDQEVGCSRSEQEDSDEVFAAVVRALGVEELDH